MKLGKSAALVAVSPLFVVAVLSVFLATEHIEAVAHVEHGVAVDAVVAGVAAAGGTDPTLVVRLLAEEVVEIEGDDERLVAEERLRYLAVPEQFVGVRRWVIVASSAALVDVAADLETEGQSDEELSAIVELPRVEVGRRLQLVARVLVVAPTVEGDFQPVVAVAEVQSLGDIDAACGVLL